MANGGSKDDAEQTGRVYGELTVIDILAPDGSGKKKCLCRCSCGNVCRVSLSNLKTGHTRSCGCLTEQRVHARLQQMTGQRYGMLRVVGVSQKRRGNAPLLICRCDCGNTALQTRHDLVSGKAKSCGCEAARARRRNFSGIHIVEGTCVERLAAKIIQRNNTSGYPGVYYNPRSGTWTAMICFQKRRHYLGQFKDREEAIAQRKRFERLHDEFVRRYREQKQTQDRRE